MAVAAAPSGVARLPRPVRTAFPAARVAAGGCGRGW